MAYAGTLDETRVFLNSPTRNRAVSSQRQQWNVTDVIENCNCKLVQDSDSWQDASKSIKKFICSDLTFRFLGIYPSTLLERN